MTTPQQPPAGGRGPQPGSAEAFIAAFGGGATDALKMLPGMLLRYLLPRLPVMGFIFIVTWLIHTFLVVYANEGFAPDTWLSPFLNVSGNAISSFLLYGFSSALLWSLLTSVFRMGPLGAITHFLTRPVLLYRQATANGRPGRGAFLLGTGAALTLNAVLAGVTIVTFGIIPRLNTPANFSLALGLTFFGMSRPGYLLAMFLSAAWSRSVARLGQQGFARTALNLKLLRGVIAGLAPGFLLAGILLVQFDVSTLTGGIINAGLALSQAAFAFLVGAALLYGAFVFLRGAVPPAQPPAPVAGLLILGTATAAAYGFLSLLFTEAAWADDGGWRESGSNLGGWITSDGALEAGVRGLPPGVGGAVGPLVPPLDGEEAEEPEPPRWALHGSGGPARLDGKPGASFTASFTVTTNDPEGDPAAAAGAMNFSVAGGAAEWFSVADDSQGGATRTLTLTMNEIDLTTLAAGAYALTLHASAPTPGGSVSASARCTVLIGGEPKLVHEFDGGKRAIVPDGRDQAVLKAKVVLVAADGTENPCDTATISFSKGNEWLDMSDPVAWDATWTAVALEASDPQGSDVTRQPPSPVTVSISATAGEQELSATASLELLGLPELDVDLRPDTVTLIQGENTPVTFKAFLTNPGSEPWQWELTLDNEQLGSTGFTETATPGVIEVAVTPPATSPEGVSGASVTTKLHIFARQGDKELERILPVILAREGLVVLPRGSAGAGRFLLKCDMEMRKEIDFVVYAKDAEGKLVADTQLVQDLWFEDNAPSQEIRNLLSVANPEYKYDRPGENNSGIWTWRSRDLIPGDPGQTFAIPMVVRVIGKEDRAEFSAEFTLALQVVEPDVGSEDWRRERDGCYRAIRFVSEPMHSRLREMIDRHAQVLGHEGLKLFRLKIWKIAQNLILAEGAEGYRSQEKWEDRALFFTENLKWGSDLVFQAAAGVAFGPLGVIGAPILKSLIENIMVVGYERGFDQVDDWFWEIVVELEQTLNWQDVVAQGALIVGGMVTDPAILERVLGQTPERKAAAWAIYVGFQFASNIARGMSMCDAMKQTARTVRDRLVVQFLMGRMNWQFKMPQAIKDAVSRMTGTPPRMTAADMIAIQRDPQLLRSLKTAPPDVQQGFLRTYNQTLVQPHDRELVDFVRSLPDYRGRVVRVESFSTPHKAGSAVGADRDFRVTMQNPDGTWREVSADLWRNQSNRIIGRLSGGNSLQQLNWRATDRFDIEASPDYATQNGQISNIVNVIRGKSTLRDPAQFGNMWHQKMTGIEPGHSAPRLEGVAQAQKAVSTLNAVRGGYRQQGYRVGNLTPQMERGMNIIKGADVTGTGNFESVDRALRGAGFTGGFDEFANKVAGQFQALGMARQG